MCSSRLTFCVSDSRAIVLCLFSLSLGWGQSFHFATKYKGESFEASIARHEYYLAARIGIKKGDTVLDVGCGVGGPLRNIARFTGAKVIGLNNNESVPMHTRMHSSTHSQSLSCFFFLVSLLSQVPSSSCEQVERSVQCPGDRRGVAR
jgi:hypothetical protein